MGTSKSQRTVLTEDGELRHIDTETDDQPATPEARLSAVFCTNCGTANQASSRFCRTCGQSLDEQVVNPASLDEYAPPERKNKRLAGRAAQAEHAGADQDEVMWGKVTVEVFTLLVVGAVLIVSIIANQGLLVLAVLIGWLLVELARHGVLGGH
jgi:ribosomal protein L32